MRKTTYISASLLLLALPIISLAAVNLYAIDLESDDAQLVSISDETQSHLDLNSDFTIEAWVKPESLVANQPMDIVSKDDSADRGYAFSFGGTPGVLQVIFLDASGNATQFETDPVITTPGEWHHVAVVTDISVPSAVFYVDGTPVPVTLTAYNAATSINNSAAPFRIGTRVGDSFYFDGSIDEVKVWSTQRTQKQIRRSMRDKVNGTPKALVGNWTFDGQTFEDSSRYGNHLTESTNASSVVFTTDTP